MASELGSHVPTNEAYLMIIAFVIFIYLYLFISRLGRGHSLLFWPLFLWLSRPTFVSPFVFCFSRSLFAHIFPRPNGLAPEHRHLLPSTNVVYPFVWRLSLALSRPHHIWGFFSVLNNELRQDDLFSVRRVAAYKCQEQMSKNCTSARTSKG